MAVSNGTVARLEKEYNVSSDDFPCHETVDSSTDSVLVDMVAGVFVFSGLMLAAGTVQGIIGEKSPMPWACGCADMNDFKVRQQSEAGLAVVFSMSRHAP
jgi:hypothetical protein